MPLDPRRETDFVSDVFAIFVRPQIRGASVAFVLSGKVPLDLFIFSHFVQFPKYYSVSSEEDEIIETNMSRIH